MFNNLKSNKILWVLVGLMAVYAALSGIFAKGAIYVSVVDSKLIPGTYGQDWMSFIAGVLLIGLALLTKEGDIKKPVIIFGLLGYYFYAYGIFVIERVYNSFYLWYLAIFTLSFWGMVCGLASLKKEFLPGLQISKPVRITSFLLALLQPLVFYPMWIAALLSLMRTHDRIENLYSIYILDLGFIMPAFLVLAYMLIKKKTGAYLFTPAIFVLGFTLIFSLSISELVKPVFGSAISNPDLLQSLILSLLFLGVGAFHLTKLKVNL